MSPGLTFIVLAVMAFGFAGITVWAGSHHDWGVAVIFAFLAGNADALAFAVWTGWRR